MDRIEKPEIADSRRRGNYRPEIDGLRAVAVLLVVAYHLDEKFVVNGFLGVDFFFVISGYVVTASLYPRLDPSRPSSLLSFYARRVKRLFPALITCILLTAVLGSMVFVRSRPSLLTGMSALFGVSNIALWFRGKDYFALDQQLNLFTHTWSLGVEEQFYLLFPPILLVIKWLRLRLLVIMGPIALLSLSAYIWVAPDSPATAFYLMPLRMWELSAGVIIFAMGSSSKGLSFQKPAVILAQLSLVMSLAVVPFLHMEQLSHLTVIATLFFALALGLLDVSGPGKSFLGRPFMAYVGKLSYSIYLWHWSILTLSLAIFGSQRPTAWVLLTILFFSIASYHLIEAPLRRARWFKTEEAQPWRVLACGVAVAATCAVALMLILRASLFQGDGRYIGATAFLRKEPCHLPIEAERLKNCLKQDTSEKVLFIIGDSHAGNLLVGARTAARELSYSVSHLTDRELVMDLLLGLGCDDPLGESEVGDRLRYLRGTLKEGDVVLFSMARDSLYDDDFPASGHRLPDQPRMEAFEKGLSCFAQKVTSLGASFLVAEDIPKVCSDIDYAVAPFAAHVCRVKSSRSLADRKPLSDIYQRVKERVPGVTTFDPHAVYCPTDECSNFLDDGLLFVDSSPHFDVRGSKRSAPIILEALSSLQGKLSE